MFFTPNGDVKSFPKGATPLSILPTAFIPDIGNKCIGAKVNRSIVPLKYQLQNGDTIEIITQTGHHPSKDWLKFVVTTRAMAKIRNWVKTEERKKSIDLGKGPPGKRIQEAAIFKFVPDCQITGNGGDL